MVVLNIRFVLYRVIGLGEARYSGSSVGHGVNGFGTFFFWFFGRFLYRVGSHDQYNDETWITQVGDLVAFFVLGLYFGVE